MEQADTQSRAGKAARSCSTTWSAVEIREVARGANCPVVVGKERGVHRGSDLLKN